MKDHSFYGQHIWKVILILITYHFSLMTVSAQTFTQRIQQQTAGQGTVTIHQSDVIDQLVNTAPLAGSSPAAQGKPVSQGLQNAASQGIPSATQSASSGSSAVDDSAQRPVRASGKAAGYRIQVYAGYNREGKQTAERTRNSLKSQYPHTAVYVHFLNPRWVCRMGNYRTYEEAYQMLVSVRNSGYNQASIVKDKITVYY